MTPCTKCSWSLNACSFFFVATSHTMQLPSTQPEKSRSPPGAQQRSYTSQPWPPSMSGRQLTLPAGRGASPKAEEARSPWSFQRTTAPSSPADARVRPSGLKRTTLTGCGREMGRGER